MGKIPYFKEAFKGLFQSPMTNRYPYSGIDIPKDYRGKIVFHSDRCVGCGMCIRVCSPGAITKTVKNVEGGQEINMKFDLGSCTFCSMCADFCGKNAIEFSREYSMVATDKTTLFVEGSFVKKLPPKPQPKPVADNTKVEAEKIMAEGKEAPAAKIKEIASDKDSKSEQNAVLKEAASE